MAGLCFIIIFSIHSISERIEYLSLSVANLKSCSFDSGRVQLPSSPSIVEQEELLEIALIQEEILVYIRTNSSHIVSTCSTTSESDLQSVINSLDKHLFSLSDLFNKITQPLKLYEFSLIIIDSAQYTQQLPLVITLWTNILQGRLYSTLNI